MRLKDEETGITAGEVDFAGGRDVHRHDGIVRRRAKACASWRRGGCGALLRRVGEHRRTDRGSGERLGAGDGSSDRGVGHIAVGSATCRRRRYDRHGRNADPFAWPRCAGKRSELCCPKWALAVWLPGDPRSRWAARRPNGRLRRARPGPLRAHPNRSVGGRALVLLGSRSAGGGLAEGGPMAGTTRRFASGDGFWCRRAYAGIRLG